MEPITEPKPLLRHRKWVLSDKYASISWVRHKFPDINLIDEIIKPKKKETILEINHDLADSICISTCLKYDDNILQDKNKMNYK